MAKFIKIYSIVLLLLAAQFVFTPHVRADLCGSGMTQTQAGLCLPSGSENAGGVNDFILKIINLLLSLCAIIAVLFIVIGGFRYITSNGNEEGAKKGLAIVRDAAIGLAIIILAYIIVAVVVNTATGFGTGG